MAHHKSAKKRIRQTERRTAVNRARVSRIRTFVKKVETAISTGDKTAAQDALRQAQPELQRGVSRGLMHRNTVARKLSRLSARIKKLGAAAPDGATAS
jgi:small subunit ribosomal protein S20